MLQHFIDNLQSTLINIKELTLKIVELEDQKYESIKNMDMETLILLNEEESMFIQKIEQAESQRLQCIKDLSPILGNSIDIPLVELIPLFPEDTQTTFHRICLETKEICQRLSIITERNEYVLKTHSEIIGQILELTQEVPVDQYNSQGLSTERKQQTLHMLDQLV